jgi:hypothetical protein
MPRFLVFTLVLLPAVALAQEVPEEARMDLWCGTAFQLMTRDTPADATPQKLAVTAAFAEGAKRLIDRALPIYLERGYSDRALAELRSKLEDSVGRIVNGSTRAGEEAAYSFQDCSALIGQ